ncbi:MAG: hypothetical protein IJ080_03535, partial [Oscillospiraceae bacterium]|nr:hypothetical protein [Oscillospiraceae bacterium]
MKKIPVLIAALMLMSSPAAYADTVTEISAARSAEYSVKANLPAIGKAVTFRFSPSMFSTPQIYDHGLGKASLIMSVAAMDSGNDDADIRGFFKAAGFDMSTYSQYRYDNEDDSDDAAVALCTLKLSSGRRIVAAAVRGGGYGGEWGSNMRVGSSDTYHEGFMKASTAVKTQIENYIREQGLEDCCLWITGYSRGGAVAGLTAARLKNTIGEDGIYAYTFAAPRSYHSRGNYKYIHNIVDPSDAVPYLPMADWGFVRPGVTHYLDLSAYSDNRKKNVDKVSKALTGEASSFDERDICLPVILSDAFCAVIPTADRYVEDGYQTAFASAAAGTDELISGGADGTELMAELENSLPMGSGLNMLSLYGSLGSCIEEEDAARIAQAHSPQNYIALMYSGGIVSEPMHTFTVRTSDRNSLYTDDGKGSIVRRDMLRTDAVQPGHPTLYSIRGENIATVT